MLRRRRCRKFDQECCAVAGFGDGLDGSAGGGDEFAADGQAQAGAAAGEALVAGADREIFGIAGGGGAGIGALGGKKRLKHARQHLDRNARAGVGEHDLHHRFAPACRVIHGGSANGQAFDAGAGGDHGACGR